MQLETEHVHAIAAALVKIPEPLRFEAAKHILDRVRGILQIEQTDIRRACNSALAKYALMEG